MTFNSLHFVLFFMIVLPMVGLLHRQVRIRNAFLLCASWYFYGVWDFRFLFLLIGSTIFDYSVGRGLGAIDPMNQRARKWLVVASCCANLGVLGFFKYFNFFIDSFTQLCLELGFHPHPMTLRIVLPVGVSFYTFQSMSYVIDVYRRHLPAEKSFLNFATFVGFFPQLVAGPIERATHLLPQIKRPNVITWDGLSSGFWLVSVGLFKKVVMADNVARVADAVFDGKLDSTPTMLASIIGIYAFAIQIYCDFSAYSDIARGAARMMGFDLMRNFNLPYFAVNPSDFWRRWHISLSTWLRDYLYIPLGGNRTSAAGVYRNLALTMLLGGLWHGATWLFVMWGAYHGLLLCVHRLTSRKLDQLIHPTTHFTKQLWWFIRVVVFFQFTCFGWLLFRAGTVANLGRMLRPFVPGNQWKMSFPITPVLLLSFIVLSIVLIIMQFSKHLNDEDHDLVFRVPTVVRAVIYAAMILGFLIFGEFGGGSFIYFQF